MSPLPPVERLLPHRGRFLLIDRVVSVEGATVVAEGRFTAEHCEGHFPGHPIVPGVLLIEALAQAMLCGHMLLDPPSQEGLLPLLAGVDRVRLRAPVRPPAELRYALTLEPARLGVRRAWGQARLGDREILSARLTAALRPPGSG